MAASADTIKHIAEVIRSHVPRPTIELIMRDLLKVPGNASFRKTVELLAKVLKSR